MLKREPPPGHPHGWCWRNRADGCHLPWEDESSVLECFPSPRRHSRKQKHDTIPHAGTRYGGQPRGRPQGGALVASRQDEGKTPSTQTKGLRDARCRPVWSAAVGLSPSAATPGLTARETQSPSVWHSGVVACPPLPPSARALCVTKAPSFQGSPDFW